MTKSHMMFGHVCVWTALTGRACRCHTGLKNAQRDQWPNHTWWLDMSVCEQHSPEELLPLTTEQLAEEQEEASHVEPPAASEGQPVTSGGEQPDSANGLRSILTEPNLSWQPARVSHWLSAVCVCGWGVGEVCM